MEGGQQCVWGNDHSLLQRRDALNVNTHRLKCAYVVALVTPRRFEGKDDDEFVTMFLGTYNCKVGLPEKIGE